MSLQKLFSLFVLALLVSSCSDRDELLQPLPDGGVLKVKADAPAVPEGDPITREKLDNTLINLLEARNGFDWSWLDLKTTWSTLQYGDGVVAIGYQPAGTTGLDANIHRVDVRSGAWKAVHDALIAQIKQDLESLSGQPVRWEEILVEDDPVLPILTLKLTDKTVLTRLASLENVRYIEPLGYWPSSMARSTSGCSPSGYGLNAADYSSILPSCILPWNFNNHQIPTAWNNAQGSGITVGVIDAGLSSLQPLLGAQFNDGYSATGRTVTTDYTWGTSAFSSCSHGTSMSAAAVGPRNASGAATGVAYKSNLHFIRAAEDVVLDLSSEKTAVKNAMIRMGDRASVRIISLSMGTPFGSSVLRDGVNYAYNKGKLIFAAAGTSFGLTTWWGVIYPAAYSSCVAVTGVKENGSRCAACHDGSAVMYTICMERSSDSNRNSLSLSPSGVTPSYIGGSSVATATTAGIAALVWSAKPNMTRSQVMTCLTNTAQFYPTRNSTKGFGNINASSAVSFALSNY
ncbi:MAG: S8 family serine peptidase [Sphingobacteriales bacterium]|jgi:serine protease|nr:S8 family serine peptidase [Sphingobacteriales bacterium]